MNVIYKSKGIIYSYQQLKKNHRPAVFYIGAISFKLCVGSVNRTLDLNILCIFAS